MNMSGVSIIGWAHTLAATAAILIGAVLIFGPKGTPRHRFAGRWYIYTMIAANALSFGVYHFDIVRFVPLVAGPNRFGLFHWESVFTLFFLLLGWYAALHQRRAIWAYLHPVSMLTTYYMLIGGLVNELFVRVPFIRAIAMAQLHGQGNPARAPIAGAVQGAVLLGFLVLFVWFITKVALRWRGFRMAAVTA
jgi:uncharacterized membrane protein